MVTKKTRWLSAMAAVILLVSMFAGIVVPAGAASGSEILNALQKKYDSFDQAHFVVEVDGFTVEEIRVKIAEQIAAYEATDLDHERAIYENIGVQADQDFMVANKGNLISDLIVRYSLKEHYEALGYKEDASAYYISDVDDWNAAAASGSVFAKTTLLVTDDIDFNGQKVDPLTVNETAFQGVLDGQGHCFIDMVIEIGDTEPEKTYKNGGLVAALTGGTIKNLGLDGGAVNFDGKDATGKGNEGLGSFAGYIGTGGLLQNCWSTMTVSNTSKDSKVIVDGKNGAAGLIGWGEGGAIDNCFFAGTVNNPGDRAATDLISYTANAVKVYNSIGAGTLECSSSRNPAAVGAHYSMYNDVKTFAIYNTYAVGKGKNALRYRANVNPYSYQTKDDANNVIYVNYVTLPDTDITFTKDITHKFTPEATNAAYKLDSLEEAVWAVNNRFDTTHQSANRDYIISVDNNGKLYMAKKGSNCIYRKVTIEGSASGVYYFKEGTKVNLLSDLNLMVADSITIDKNSFASALDGYDLTVPAGDIVLTIEYSYESELGFYVTELTKRVQKYEKLDFDLFDCSQLLKDWLKAAKAELAKEEKDLDKIKELLEMESGEEGFRNVMALHPDTYPSAKDYEAYQEFNNGKEWAIATKEDWLAMINLSKDNTFEGDIFHVLKDIDFDKTPGDDSSNVGVQMAPLNYIEGTSGVDSTLVSFKGTIEGHGNAFLNVNVYAGPSNPEKPTATAAGLIGKLGEGAVIRNFGVESGTIEVACKNNDQASTFGEMVGAATLTKVWSGADIICESGANSGSHGIVAHSQNTIGSVNGAYFYGTLITTGSTDVRAMAIAGDNMNTMSIYNSLGAPIVSDSITNSKAFACIRYTNAGSVHLANNYGVNLPVYYANIDNANTTDMVESVLEGAYKINQGNRGLTGANGELIKAVYFTMKDGKVAFGKDDGSDQIRKITFVNNGAVVGEMYATAGTTVKLVCEKADGFGSILVGYSSTLNGDMLELGNEDVTIEAVIDNTEAIKVRIAVVRELMAKYEGLNPDEFANGDEITAWKTAAQKAIDDEDLVALNSAVEREKALEEGLILKDGFWPAFTQYNKYKEFNTKNDWLIASKEDWAAMDAYAKAAPEGNYFEGFTFHLTKDVDFSSDTAMLPLGAKTGRLFAGTIDGHGYGFENVNIAVIAENVAKGTGYYDGTMTGSIGLIAFLGKCEIRDFGINSGTINAGAGGGTGNASTFGCVPENTLATAPTFTRVWSGADLTGAKNTHINGLVGILASKSSAVKVNGFVFNGTMSKIAAHGTAIRNTAYGVYGGSNGAPADKGEFYNIITYPTVDATKLSASFIFGFPTEAAFKTAIETNKLKNVYGLGGITKTYRIGISDQTAGKTTFDGVDYDMIKDMSDDEVAWNANQNSYNPTGKAEDVVYFTMKDGKLRPTAKADEQIRKVVIMEDGKVVETLYKIPNEKVTLNGTDYKLTEGALSTLEGNVLTVGNEDVVLSKADCEHTDVTYSHNAGTKTHTIHCNDCGKDLTGNCEVGSWTANDDLVIADGVVTAGTHRASCKDCGGVQTENCQGTLVPNAVDCTEDGTMTFDCCDREAVTAIGSGKAGHTHNGNWTEVGAPVGKEIDKCLFCDAYLVRSCGKVNVSTGNLVYAGKEVDVVITLPYALNNAEIEIAPAADSKYAITNIAAENLDMSNPVEQGGTYTAALANVQEGATITVTVKTEQYGFVANGLLNVKVFNAKNAEGDVTDATNEALITLKRMRGDADANGVLSVMDALVVLQYSVDQPVLINTANAEMNEDGNVDATDAMLIVREWMLTV